MRAGLLIFIGFALFGCLEKTDCLINNSNVLKIGWMGKTSGKDTTITFVAIRTLQKDTLFSNKNLGVAEVRLPTKDTIKTVIFDYLVKTKKVSDTLVVAYRNETRVIAIECGAYLYHKDLKIRKTTFKRARVSSSILLTSVKKNLEIFL